MTDDNVVSFKSEIYKNFSMTAMEVREWLNFMPLNDSLVNETITKIATGAYPKILDELDQFIKILVRSKHNENGDALKRFSNAMTVETIARLNLRKHGTSITSILLANAVWQFHDILKVKKSDYETWRSSRAAAKQKRS